MLLPLYCNHLKTQVAIVLAALCLGEHSVSAALLGSAVVSSGECFSGGTLWASFLSAHCGCMVASVGLKFRIV